MQYLRILFDAHNFRSHVEGRQSNPSPLKKNPWKPGCLVTSTKFLSEKGKSRIEFRNN